MNELPTATDSGLDALVGEYPVRNLAGNEPLLLSATEAAWYVKTGKVDIFAVPIKDGVPAGARKYLCTIAQGGLVWGGPATANSGVGLVGVGILGTQLAEASYSRVHEMLNDSRFSHAIAPLIEQWIRELLKGVGFETPRGNVLWAQPNQETPLSIQAYLSAAMQVCWIETQSGMRFQGSDSLPEGILIPVIAPGCLQMEREGTTLPLATLAALSSSRGWIGLDHFHRIVVAQAATNIQKSEIAEVARLNHKAACEQQLLNRSLKQVASLVQQAGWESPSTISTDDPLLAACQLVAQRLGIELHAPPNYGRLIWSDPLSAIARNSGVRFRRVLLTEGWWQQDNGPMLGFRAADSRPLALLPTSVSQYQLVDWTHDEQAHVTQAVSDTLQPYAYCFYRGFSTQELSPRKLFKFGLLGTRRDWLATAAFGLAGGVLGMLVPVATGVIFGRIIPRSQHDQLLLVVVALILSAMVMALLELTRGIAVHRVQTRMTKNMEAAIWDRLLNLPASFFRNYSAGDLATRAMSINYIRQAMTDAAMTSVVSFAFSIVSFALLFYFNRSLAMVAVGVFLVVLAVSSYAAFRQIRHRRAYYAQSGQTAGIVLQLLTGISRLRVAGAEIRALAYWSTHYIRQAQLAFRAQHVANKLAAFIDSVPVVGSVILFASVSLLSTNAISVGEFLAFFAAFTQLTFAAAMLSSALSSLVEVVPLYERAAPILKTSPERHLINRPSPELTGEIEINHVSFRYSADGPTILDDISLHIRPGEFVALVGPSAAGKSTILRLLLGFEYATTGSIYLDREDISGLDLQMVRRQMGVILQNSQLSPGDILSNITRSYQYTPQQAWEAAQMTGLDQDIQAMPMGVYTVVSDGEATLSGGQRQRLLITRAIVSKPNIVLFDEATSALDNVSQAKVAESLQNLKATRIVVAHRLSTIVNADRICVIDHGKLVQEGNYQKLISQPGPFAELAKRQLL